MGQQGGWADDSHLNAPRRLQSQHFAQEEPNCWSDQKLEIWTISNLVLSYLIRGFMSLIRSIKFALLEFISHVLQYRRNSMCTIIHSKLLLFFCFPQSIRMVIQVSCSSLCFGSCNGSVHTIGPVSLTSNIFQRTCPYLARSPNISQLTFSILKTVVCWLSK